MTNELWLYDVIGSGLFEAGITAKSVRDDMAKFDKSKPILARFNTPGGSMREAVAIHTLLSQWKAGVNGQIDSLAASAGSYIMLACQDIAMVEGAFVMIHRPYMMAVGDADEMRAAAEYLDKGQEIIVKAYAKKSGKKPDELHAMMEAETWMTCEEAIKSGFVDRKLEGIEPVAFTIPEAFNFKHPPQQPLAPKQRPNKLAAMQKQLDLARASVA